MRPTCVLHDHAGPAPYLIIFPYSISASTWGWQEKESDDSYYLYHLATGAALPRLFPPPHYVKLQISVICTWIRAFSGLCTMCVCVCVCVCNVQGSIACVWENWRCIYIPALPLPSSLHLSCYQWSISFGNEVWKEREREKGRVEGYMRRKRNKFCPPPHTHTHAV